VADSSSEAMQRLTHQYADHDGHFRRKDSTFRNWISTEPGARFAPEKDRYALYVNYGCPWVGGLYSEYRHARVLSDALTDAVPPRPRPIAPSSCAP